MQQVVRKQTEYGSQTESRKYRVNGKKLCNTAYFDTCHTHIYTHILPQMHTKKIKTMWYIFGAKLGFVKLIVGLLVCRQKSV